MSQQRDYSKAIAILNNHDELYDDYNSRGYVIDKLLSEELGTYRLKTHEYSIVLNMINNNRDNLTIAQHINQSRKG